MQQSKKVEERVSLCCSTFAIYLSVCVPEYIIALQASFYPQLDSFVVLTTVTLSTYFYVS